MRRLPIVLGLLWLGGCGGEQHPSSASGPPPDEVETSFAPSTPGMVSPEKYEEVRAYFARKRDVVSRCYSDAVGSGKLKRTAAGRITVGLQISPQGQPSEVHIAQTTLQSEIVEQ